MSAPAKRLPIASVTAGEHVTLHLRGRASDAINAWGGEVVAVDGVALRIATTWRRFCLSPSPTAGEVIIPWSRIDRIRIEEPS